MNRKELIVHRITKEVFPNAPHIVDGRMSWIIDPRDNSLIGVDLFLPKVPLLIQIEQPNNFLQFFLTKNLDKSRRLAQVIREAELHRIPYLVIPTTAPIDVENLRIKCKEAIQATRYRTE